MMYIDAPRRTAIQPIQLCVAICMLALSMWWPVCAAADEAPPAGKVITLFVSTSAGGGYDMYARLLARYMPKYLPGSPTIVVKNMTGAGGLVLANYLFNLAPKDGSEIAAFEGSTAFTPFLNGTPVKFDPAKFNWLGSLDKFVPIVMTLAAKPVYKFEDLKRVPISIGGSGAGSSTAGYPYSLNAMLGTKFKVINGYPGSGEINLALERGELDGVASWCWDCLKRDKPDWVTNGKVRVLLQLSFEGDPELNAMGVPTMNDVVNSESDKRILSIILGSAAFGRPFAAPPGVPAPVLERLRAAFKAAAQDPGLLDDLKAMNSTTRYSPPAVVEKLLSAANALDAETLKKLQAAYSGLGQ